MGEQLGVPMGLKSNRRVGNLGAIHKHKPTLFWHVTPDFSRWCVGVCRDDPELHAYLQARHAMMQNPATGVAVAKNMLNGGLPWL